MRLKYRTKSKVGKRGFGKRYANKMAGRHCYLARLGTTKVLDKRGAERTIIHCTYVNKGKSYGRS